MKPSRKFFLILFPITLLLLGFVFLIFPKNKGYEKDSTTESSQEEQANEDKDEEVDNDGDVIGDTIGSVGKEKDIIDTKDSDDEEFETSEFLEELPEYKVGSLVIKYEGSLGEDDLISQMRQVTGFSDIELTRVNETIFIVESKELAELSSDYFSNVDSEKVAESIDPELSFVFERVNTISGIVYSEPDYKVSLDFIPNDTYFEEQWSLNNTGQTGGTEDADIDAPEAWDIEMGDSEAVVAVIDTGVDLDHPDLADQILKDGDGNVIGYDFANDDSDPDDDLGHGTHCSGVIAAETNNTIGVAGICPNCKIMPLKFLNSYGSGWTSDAILSFQYAIDHGADVTSNSYGSYGYSQALQDVITDAYNQGIISVAASGNDGLIMEIYPSAMQYVVSVAATDHNDVKTSWSNYGSFIDFSAPGTKILSTFPPGAYLSSSCSDASHGGASDGYGYCGGTSMSAPHVSGVLGLIVSQHPEWTPYEKLTLLNFTADDIYHLNPYYVGRLGVGRVNAHKAMSTEGEIIIAYHELIIDPTTGIWPNGLLEPGESVDFYVELKSEWLGAYSVEAVLTTTDPYVTLTQDIGVYGDIIGGEVRQNQDPYSLSLSDQVSPGYEITFELYLTYKDRDGVSFDAIEEFTYAVTNDIGWPKVRDDLTDGGPMLFVDLDLDGIKEVVFNERKYLVAGRRTFILAYTYDGYQIWAYELPYREEIGTYSVAIASGDVDGDPYPEIVFGTSKTSWYAPSKASLNVLEHDGTLKWRVDEYVDWPPTLFDPDPSFTTPTLADLDGDSILEIIVGVHELQRLRAYNGVDGNQLWERDGTDLLDDGDDFYNRMTNSSVGDLDDDGKYEIVTSFYQNYQHGGLPYGSKVVVTNSDGTDYNVGIDFDGERAFEAPILGDVDGDGDLEMIVSVTIENPDNVFWGKVYIYHHNGELMPGWPKITNYSTYPAIADMDMDGDLEIFINTRDGYLHAWHHDGSNLGNWPIYEPLIANSYPITKIHPVIGDIDGDGEVEILDHSISKHLLAYNLDGTPVEGYPLVLEKNDRIMNVVLGNLGNNDNVQIGFITLGLNTAFLIDTDKEYNPETMQWPMNFHDNQRTGCFDIGQVYTEADVSLTISSSEDSVNSGEEVTYTVEVTNNGPHPASTLTITQEIPETAELVSISPNDKCNEKDHKITCKMGVLKLGASVSIDIKITPLAEGGDREITTTAWVSADQYDPDLSNNADSVSTYVDVGVSDMYLIYFEDDQDPAFVGDSLKYRVVILTLGPETARDVVVTITLPENLEFDYTDGGWPGIITHENNVVTWRLDQLEKGWNVDLAVFAVVKEKGHVVTTAEISSDKIEDPVLENNSLYEETDLQDYAAPGMVYPQDNQVLGWGEDQSYMFKIDMPKYTVGFEYEFIQEGIVLFQDYVEDLTGEFAVHPDHPKHGDFQPGLLEVKVRSKFINGKFTEAGKITVILVDLENIAGPIFLYPQNGSVVLYDQSAWIWLEPVAGADGYLFGFYQNGELVYEEFTTERDLIIDDVSSPMFSKGPMWISARALVGGHWSKATTIYVEVKESDKPTPPP